MFATAIDHSTINIAYRYTQVRDVPPRGVPHNVCAHEVLILPEDLVVVGVEEEKLAVERLHT